MTSVFCGLVLPVSETEPFVSPAAASPESCNAWLSLMNTRGFSVAGAPAGIAAATSADNTKLFFIGASTCDPCDGEIVWRVSFGDNDPQFSSALFLRWLQGMAAGSQFAGSYHGSRSSHFERLQSSAIQYRPARHLGTGPRFRAKTQRRSDCGR